MKKPAYLPMAILLAVLASCNNNKTTGDASAAQGDNPFFKASTLLYQAPEWDKIKNEHFKPAMEEGMKQQLAEVQKIADNPEAPTFENTLVAMEKTGSLLNRVGLAFNVLTGANTNNDLQKLQEEEAPKLAATNDEIYLNAKLFKRVEAIYNQRDQLKLDPESKRLVEFYYQKFELAGAKLSDADKAKLKDFNKQEAGLSAKFTNKLLNAAKAGALVANDTAELAGLSKGDLDAAAQAANRVSWRGNGCCRCKILRSSHSCSRSLTGLPDRNCLKPRGPAPKKVILTIPALP